MGAILFPTPYITNLKPKSSFQILKLLADRLSYKSLKGKNESLLNPSFVFYFK